MRRREQREHIFKLLFISEFNTQKEMEEQLALYLADIENLEESDRDYISRKYMNIMNHTDELDEKLNSISMGWKTSRMNRVDLTVLRLAVYELEYEKEEVPVGVAINEAVELAKCFGSEESGAFVNGILGKIANPDKKVAARKASSKKGEQTSARPKSGFKVKDPSKKVVVVNRNVAPGHRKIKMNNVYSVGQVNRYVKHVYPRTILQIPHVKRGEVSTVNTLHRFYLFTLKDEGGTLKCVMFAGSRRGLAFRMKDGDKVIAGGRVDVYERDGAYQFYAKEITLEGAGALYERYLALKQELEDMGMFAQEYKQPIPEFAHRVGIVTSPTGAAIRDIINVSTRRNPFIQSILYPCAGGGSSGQYCTWYPHAGRGRRGCDHCRPGRWFYRGTMGF